MINESPSPGWESLVRTYATLMMTPPKLGENHTPPTQSPLKEDTLGRGGGGGGGGGEDKKEVEYKLAMKLYGRLSSVKVTLNRSNAAEWRIDLLSRSTYPKYSAADYT
jgi:hypothetical protein